MGHCRNRIRIAAASLCISFVLVGCATPESAWQEAQNRDSFSSYQKFLTDYPNSEFSTEAQKRLHRKKAQRAFELASRDNRERSFAEIVREYPDTEYASIATEKLAQFEFDRAARANRIIDWRQFLRKFPSSRLATEAQSRIDKLTADLAQSGTYRAEAVAPVASSGSPSEATTPTSQPFYPYFHFGKAFPFALLQMPKDEIKSFVEPYDSFRKTWFGGNESTWPQKIKTAELDYRALLLSLGPTGRGKPPSSTLEQDVRTYLTSWIGKSGLNLVTANADIRVFARLAGWSQFESSVIPSDEIVAVFDVAIKLQDGRLLRSYHLEIPYQRSYFGNEGLVDAKKVVRTIGQRLPPDLRKTGKAAVQPRSPILPAQDKG